MPWIRILFFKCIFWAFCAFIDRRETVDRLVKGGERVGEDTLQTGHRRDLNLDRQKHVHGVLTTTPNQHPNVLIFMDFSRKRVQGVLVWRSG